MRLRRALPLSALFAAGCVLALLVATSSGATGRPSQARQVTCSAGYVDALIGGAHKCLRAGEFCSSQYESDYERYGFACVDGHLEASGAPPPTTSTTTSTVPLGTTAKLGSRTRTNGCTRGALPDRRCSPGAYYTGLTTAVICSPTFRTSSIRNVPAGEKYAVEREYGLPAKSYGRTIEIDHIVSLELGGSNDIANLFPEPGSGALGYHVKDKLENRLHAAVCSGQMSLAAARRGIATNWIRLYHQLFGPGA